jgi:hypothetical protein
MPKIAFQATSGAICDKNCPFGQIYLQLILNFIDFVANNSHIHVQDRRKPICDSLAVPF